MDITWKGADSTNYTKGRLGNDVVKIVVHWIVGRLESADATFQNPARNASAHYGVGDEDVHQYVKDEDTAWHCGDWLWNLKTIGIEHEGGPNLPISEKTYESSAKLIKSLSDKFSIPLDKEHIVPHSHFVPTACPGNLDIDKLISLAKGENMDNCENELQEMRVSRNYWKQKVDDLEQTLGLEREENSNEIVSKQKIIDDQQKLISELQAKSLLDAKSYADMEKERTQWREAYIALEIQFNAYKTEKLQEIVNLSNKLADSEKKLEKCQVETKKMSLKDFIIIKYFKKG